MRTLFTFFTFCLWVPLTAQVVHNLSDQPIHICENGLKFPNFESNGIAKEALSKNSCLGEMDWLSSVWVSVTIEEPGDLAFRLSPNNRMDDIDFVVYKSNDNSQRNEFTLMRCMATGIRLDRNIETQSNCNGSTGLQSISSDVQEKAGCEYFDDNYLRSIQAARGDQFLILITNYNSIDGFQLELTGSAGVSDLPCQELVTGITVDAEEFQISELHPNPVLDKAFIDMTMKTSAEVHLQVSNIDGRVVYNREMYMTEGDYQLKIPAKNLTPGTYVVRVVVGKKEYVTKFLKTQVN